MSLVSNLFLLFVAVSVLVYYIVPHKFQWLVLLCFSYIYYLAGGVRYVGLSCFPHWLPGGLHLQLKRQRQVEATKVQEIFWCLVNIEFWYAWSGKVYKFYD